MWHFRDCGPFFNNALAVWNPMNDWKNGCCYVKGHKHDNAKYCVEKDTQGNSVLTGEGSYNGHFTCTGLEVFLIE